MGSRSLNLWWAQWRKNRSSVECLRWLLGTNRHTVCQSQLSRKRAGRAIIASPGRDASRGSPRFAFGSAQAKLTVHKGRLLRMTAALRHYPQVWGC